jgi:hypothetical protein
MASIAQGTKKTIGGIPSIWNGDSWEQDPSYVSPAPTLSSIFTPSMAAPISPTPSAASNPALNPQPAAPPVTSTQSAPLIVPQGMTPLPAATLAANASPNTITPSDLNWSSNPFVQDTSNNEGGTPSVNALSGYDFSSLPGIGNTVNPNATFSQDSGYSQDPTNWGAVGNYLTSNNDNLYQQLTPTQLTQGVTGPDGSFVVPPTVTQNPYQDSNFGLMQAMLLAGMGGAVGLFNGAGAAGAATPAEAASPITNSVLADSAAGSAGYGASSAGAGLGAYAPAASAAAPSLAEATAPAAASAPAAQTVAPSLEAATAPAANTVTDQSVFANMLSGEPPPIPSDIGVPPVAPQAPIPDIPGTSLIDNPMVQKGLGGAVSGGLSAAIQGQNPLQGAINGGVGGTVSGGIGMATGGLTSVLNDLGLGSLAGSVTSGVTSGLGGLLGGIGNGITSMINGSTDPLTGSNTNPTQNFGNNLLNSLIGQYGYNAASKANTDFINNLNSLYSPNSAYAQTLQKQLDARDAATGRRSQYGPRAVELQAALANAAQRNSGVLSQALATQNNLLSGNLRNWGTTLGNSGLGGVIGSGLQSLFGTNTTNPSSGGLTIMPTTPGGVNNTVPQSSGTIGNLFGINGYGESSYDPAGLSGGGSMGLGTWTPSGAQVDPFGTLLNGNNINPNQPAINLTGNPFVPNTPG